MHIAHSLATLNRVENSSLDLYFFRLLMQFLFFFRFRLYLELAHNHSQQNMTNELKLFVISINQFDMHFTSTPMYLSIRTANWNVRNKKKNGRKSLFFFLSIIICGTYFRFNHFGISITQGIRILYPRPFDLVHFLFGCRLCCQLKFYLMKMKIFQSPNYRIYRLPIGRPLQNMIFYSLTLLSIIPFRLCHPM